jgi:hypothetical protein
VPVSAGDKADAMTLSATELDVLTAPREGPWSLADLEALCRLWGQLKQQAGAPAAVVAVPDRARLAERLERLRIGGPPAGIAEEVAAVWRRHAESWAAQEPVAALLRDLDELAAAGQESEAVHAQRLQQIELLKVRCAALESLAEVLDRLVEPAALDESESGGEP